MTVGLSTPKPPSNLVGQEVLVVRDAGEEEPSPFPTFVHGTVTSLRVAPNRRDAEAVLHLGGGGPDDRIVVPTSKLYPLEPSRLALEHSDVSYSIRETGLPLHRGTVTATVMARLPRICTADVPPKMRMSLVSSRSPLGEVLGGSSGSIGHRQKVGNVDLEDSAHVVWIVGEGDLAATWSAMARSSSRGSEDERLRSACLLTSLIATDCSARCHAALFLNGSYSIEAFPLTSNADEAYVSLLLGYAYSYLMDFTAESTEPSAFHRVRGLLSTTGLSWPVISDPKKLRDLGNALSALDIDVDAFMRVCCALMLLVQSSSISSSLCIRPEELICDLLGLEDPLDKQVSSIEFVHVLQRGLLCWAASLEVSDENGDGTIIVACPADRRDSYGSYGDLLLTREALRIARCTRAADYIDERFHRDCERIKLPTSGDEGVLDLFQGSSLRLVRHICQAAADEQVGQDWLDAAKESVESVRGSGVGAHLIVVTRDEKDPLEMAHQLWLFSTIAATRVNPMMKPFHIDIVEARERLALKASSETEILEELSATIGVPPGGLDIRKGSLRIGMGAIGSLLKHEAALMAPRSKKERCERILKSCMTRQYAAKAVRKVVQIQSLYRSWLERKESLDRVPRALNCLFGALCLLRRVNEFSKRHAAVVHIQRVWRQKRTRMKYAGYIMQLRRIRAAIVLQAFYRRLAAVKLVDELRLKRTRVYSVEIIQCFIRRYLAQLTLLSRAYRLRVEKAAVVVQAYWRGVLVRRWWGRVRGGLPWLALIIKAKLIAMHDAQVRLSAWWRGTATRVVRSGTGKRVYDYLAAAREDIWGEVHRSRSARRIQTRWRSHSQVGQFRALTEATRVIQDAMRTTSWRRWWVSIRRTVIHLQRHFRARAELAEMERQLRASEWSNRSITHRVFPTVLGRDICVIHAPENAEETLTRTFDSYERSGACDLHIFGSRCKHVVAVKDGWLWVSGHLVPPPPRLEALSVKTVACGSQHVLFTCNETELCFAWGSNSMGQCGLPQDAVAFLRTPLAIPLRGCDGRVKLIAASGKTSAYVTKRRPSRVHVIGQCMESECADLADFGDTAIIARITLSVYEDTSRRVLKPCVFVLTGKGELFSWGDNTCKQLGRLIEDSSLARVPGKVQLGDVRAAGRVVQVSVAPGAVYVLAVTDVGEVFVWGTVMRAHAGDPPEAFNFDLPTSVILPVENTAAIQVAASWGDTWFVVLAPECSVWRCRGLCRRGAFAVIENAETIEWPTSGSEARTRGALLRSSNSVKGSLVYMAFEYTVVMLSSDWSANTTAWESPYDLVADGSSSCRPLHYLTVFDFTTLQNPDTAAYLVLPVYEATLAEMRNHTKRAVSPTKGRYSPFQTVLPMRNAATGAGDAAPPGAQLALELMSWLMKPDQDTESSGFLSSILERILEPGTLETLVAEEWHHTVFLLLSEVCDLACPPRGTGRANFTTLVERAISPVGCGVQAAEAWLDIALDGNHLEPAEREKFTTTISTFLTECHLSDFECRCPLWRKLGSIPSTIASPPSRAPVDLPLTDKSGLAGWNRLHLCTHNASVTTHIKEGTVSAHVVTADGYTGASLSSPIPLGVHIPHAEVIAVLEFVIALQSGQDDHCWYTNSLGHQQSLPQLWACEWMCELLDTGERIQATSSLSVGAGDHVIIRCPIVKALNATYERLFLIDDDARDIFASEVLLHAVPYSKLSWLRRPSESVQDYASMRSEWTIGPIPLCRGKTAWPFKLPQDLRFDRYLRYVEKHSLNITSEGQAERKIPNEEGAPTWGSSNSTVGRSIGVCAVMDGLGESSPEAVRRYILSIMNVLPVEKLFLYSPTPVSSGITDVVEEFAEDEERVETFLGFAAAFFGKKSAAAAATERYRHSMDDSALVHCMHRARLYGLNSLLVIPSIQLDTLPLLNEDHWNELRRIRQEDDIIASVEIKMPAPNCRPHKCRGIWLVDPDLVVDFVDGEPRPRPRSTILRNSSLFSFPTL
ncbi:hypothetical protein FOZ63_017713, partial [Perkinsus olseni]